MAEPTAKPTPALTRPAPRRTRSLVAPRSWRDWVDPRWVIDRMSRENLSGILRTMIWVVPLTLLIWLYAEREQIETFRDRVIRIEAVTSDPNRVVTIRGGSESIIVDLVGPRARVEDVLRELSGDGLQLQVDPNLSGDQALFTRSLVERHQLFVRSGITVTRVTPDRIGLTVDDLVRAEIPVRAPLTVTNLDPGTEFRPPTIAVRGPRTVVESAQRSDVAAIAQIAHLEELQTPGRKDVQDVAVALPEVLRGPHMTVLGPSVVDATLHVRDRDAVWVMPSMPVWAGGPDGLFDEYTLTYRNSLPNVRLVGPKDQLDALRAQYEQGRGTEALALLLVSAEDAGERNQKRLLFENLPQGVRVHEDVQRQPWEFSLTPK